MKLEHGLLLGSFRLRCRCSYRYRLGCLYGSLLYLGLNHRLNLYGFGLYRLNLGLDFLLGLNLLGFNLYLGLLLYGLGRFRLSLLGLGLLELNRFRFGFLLSLCLVLTQVNLTYCLELNYRLLGDNGLNHLRLLLGRLLLLYRLLRSSLSAHAVLKETVGLLTDSLVLTVLSHQEVVLLIGKFLVQVFGNIGKTLLVQELDQGRYSHIQLSCCFTYSYRHL